MIAKLMKYKIKGSEVNNVKFWIAEFIQAVREKESGVAVYEVYEVSKHEFLHIMKFKDPLAEQNHNDTNHHTLFFERLLPQCDEEPTYKDIIPIE